MEPKKKILLIGDLVKKVEQLKKSGNTVVQSHGIFDLIHPGVIAHLNSARTQGEILIVTIVRDHDVRKGTGRPLFPENMRAENVASLEQVDYVSIVSDERPFESINKIKPDIFAKGQPYKERDSKIHTNLFEEDKELYFGKCKIFETEGFSFSSSRIINNFLDVYPEETRAFLQRFVERYSFDTIADGFTRVKKLKVLLIGDGIIDEYHYCQPLGKSAKAILVVNKYLSHEVFAGGAFAIANHLAGICDDVQLISLLGGNDSREDFIKGNLKPNVKTRFFYRDDAPTIVKKRYINHQLNQKLFEVNYLNDNYINNDLEGAVTEYLKSTIPLYDIVLISDFGHGFITNKIIRLIEESGIRYAVNTQTNGANTGYNMITKYHNPTFVCLDEPEVRLTAQDKYGDIDDVARGVAKAVNSEYFIVTLGKNGSIGVSKSGDINKTPIFSTKVVDTVGAGDAFFAFTAPCVAQGMPLDLASFIGNAVGALAVQIVGNKKPVEKYELLEFVHTLLR